MLRPMLALLPAAVFSAALFPAALLIAACSGSSGSSQPPPAPAKADDDPPGGGFASIPDPEPPARTQHSSECSPELAARIRSTFGERCRFERACGEVLVGVDCEAAVDGPYYYVRADSLEIVSRCGGHCMSGPCTDCPPKGWTCATY